MEAANDAGHGESPLDTRTEADRAMLRRQMTRYPKRWSGITPEVKQAVVNGLSWAIEEAQTVTVPDDPLAGPKVVASVGKTIAMIEAQNQKDEHAEDERNAPLRPPMEINLNLKLWGKRAPVEEL